MSTAGPLRWESRGQGAVLDLVAWDDGCAVLEDGGALARCDATGARAPGLAVGPGPARAARRAARVGKEWLVWTAGEAALARVGAAAPARFAAGQGAIEAFAASSAGVVVARADALELWSVDGKRKWSAAVPAVVGLVLTGSAVAALTAPAPGEAALVFVSASKGEEQGTLRLATTDAPEGWRLARIDASKVALGLGEWVVLVDAGTRKVLRRVRVPAAVQALAADAEWVAAGLEGGAVVGVHVESGEARGGFEAHDGGVVAVALGKDALFTAGAQGVVRAWSRGGLGASARAASPVTAIASRGDLVVAGDQAGRVRVLQGAAEVATIAIGDPATAVHVTRAEGIVACTSRVIVHAPKPWSKPRPVALRAPASAFAADDAYAFVGTERGVVDVYDLESSEHVTSYELSEGAVSALVRLPGTLLVVGTGALDGRVFVVDVAAAKVKHRIEAHEEAFGVTSLACDPRGRIVASGSDDGSVALLDPTKGRILARLRVRETPASLAFDKTGRRVACAFADATAALFTLGPGKASVEDVGLRGASQVAWGGAPVFGLADGRIERLAAG